MRYLIYLTLLVSTSLYAGTIHKWVDENGNVHYGDAPPVSTKTENVSVQSAPSNPGKALPRLSTQEASDEAGGGGAGAEEPDPDSVSTEQAQSICAQAKNDLDVIENSTRIKLKQADGNIRYLSDDEIAQRKAKSQNQVRLYCK